MKVSSFRLASAVIVFCLMTTLAFGQGQVTFGVVTGTVADETAAVMGGANVVLKNEATGITRETQTNAQGAFRFDSVTPGNYTVTITAPGFRTLVASNIVVSAGRSADVGFRRMEVGGREEVVEVHAATVPIIETQSAQISTTFSSRQMQALRTGLGGIDVMAILTPGVTPGFGNINNRGMQVSANGQRARSTQFIQDGIQMNDISVGGPSFFTVNLDTIAEYQVITNQFDASLGRNLGATVSTVSKSGTNNLHGSVNYAYFTSGLRSKTAAESRLSLDKPKFLEHRWNVNAGGPIVRDQAFWYFSYGGGRDLGSAISVPSGNNRVITPNGIAALLAHYPGAAPVIWYQNMGPFNISIPGDGFRCQEGSTSLLSGPTATFGADPNVMVESCLPQRAMPDTTKFYEFNTKGDLIRGNHSVAGGYAVQKNTPCCFEGGANGAMGYWYTVPNTNDSVRATWTYNFSPRTINQFKFAWARLAAWFDGIPASNAFPAQQGVDVSRQNVPLVAMPLGFASVGIATNLPQGRSVTTWQWSDQVTLQRGRHQIKMGVDLNFNRTFSNFLPNHNGTFQFNSLLSGAAGREEGFQRLVTNDPRSVQFTAGNVEFTPTQFDRFFYVQNDFKWRPNVTFNLGLRYEYSGQPINSAHEETLLRESNPATAFWLLSVPIQDRTIRRFDGDKNNFAPRIGVAWQPRIWPTLFGDNKTVIRAGYGMAYELAFYNILLNMTTAAPRVFSVSLSSPTLGAFAAPPLPSGTARGADVAAAFPVPVNTIDPRGLTQTDLSPKFYSPYGQNWTLGIQREFLGRNVFEVRYVGTNAVGQFQTINGNPLFTNLLASFPQFVPAGVTPCTAGNALVPQAVGRPRCDRGALRIRQNSAFSNYHSLQTRWDTRNLFNQLTAGVAYTWAKGIDNSSEIFNFTAGGTGTGAGGSVAFSENPFNYTSAERAVSNNNLKHTLAFHYIWDIPFMRAQEGVLGKILGGWSLNGVTRLLSGRPYAVFGSATGNSFCGQDTAFNTFFIGWNATCRPFLANPSGATPAARYIPNTNANITTTPFGAPRNSERGEYFHQWDFAIDKRIKVSEGTGFRYRAAMQNLWNRRNKGLPTGNIDSSQFGNNALNNVAGRAIRMHVWFEW